MESLVLRDKGGEIRQNVQPHCWMLVVRKWRRGVEIVRHNEGWSTLEEHVVNKFGALVNAA
jgi:hypothetical protein